MQSLAVCVAEAKKNNRAVGHFNVATLEQLKAVVTVAQRLAAPVIVGVSEGERAFIGVHQISALIASYRADGIELYLNADHTHTLRKAQEAAEAGFDAILFDPNQSVGGKLSLEENIAQTKEVVRVTKAIRPNILIEGELGYIGTSSEVLPALPTGVSLDARAFTTREEAVRFVEETGVDFLAPAVGNVHGIISGGNPALDIERIRAIATAVPTPLVLHGGSGVSDTDFRAAIAAGIAVIHISTELRVAWREGLAKSLNEHPNEVAPPRLEPSVIETMEQLVERRLRLFGWGQ